MAAGQAPTDGLRRAIEVYGQGVRVLVHGLTVLAGLGILGMVGVTCVDVVFRILGRPFSGTMDVVKLLSAVTIACGLPYTTACKGHVAIEFFFQKLSVRWRIVVDTLARLAAMALFALLAWGSLRYGSELRSTGTVTATIQLPVFWVLYVIAVCCVAVMLIKIYHILSPGRSLMKP